MADRRAITRDVHLLTRSAPDPSAPLACRAEWYERKANLLDRLAAVAVTPASPPEVRELAERARLQARRLRICARLHPGGGR